MKKFFLAVLLLNCFAFIAFAQEENQPKEKKYEVQFNFNTESLTRDLGTWQTASLYLQRKFDNKQIVWGNYRLSDRKSIRDQEFVIGTYKPLKNKWAITAEAMYSPTRKYVGKFSVLGEVEKGFKNGWVGHIGTRYTAYTTVKATTAYGQIEKYWGNNRAAYTLYVTNLSNAGTAPNHRIQYNRYYGENSNSFGVAVSFGREHESLGPTLGVLRSKTWSVSISERHWITKNFGFNVDATIHRQGNLYYRRGINFGLRYRF